MFERIVARLVERALPADIEDPEQERIAQEAAANGIRQAARVAGIAGGILCVLIAAVLYLSFPRQRIRPGPSEATSAAPQARAEANAMLRQTIEDLQKQLADVTTERETLQGKVAALERQAAEVMAARKDAPPPPRPATGPARTSVLKRPPQHLPMRRRADRPRSGRVQARRAWGGG